MRVLIINQHMDDFLGGSELQCDLIATHLINFGHEVIYAAINGRSDKHYHKLYEVAPINKSVSNILELCSKKKPDIVYWRYNRNIFYRSVKKINQLAIPVVFAVSHVNDVSLFIKNQKNFKNISNLLHFYIKNLKHMYNILGFKYIQGITVLNPDFLNVLKLKNQRLIYNSMNESVSHFDWDRPFCLWVSNIKTRKNPEVFIELARKYQTLDLDFIMIGAIQSSEYLYLEKRLDLPDNLYYLGPKEISEVNGVVKKSLFVVHTCEPEGFGNIFIQAWWFKKPTLSLKFDPYGIIESEGLGYYSKTLNQLELDLLRVYYDKHLREEIGNRAYLFSRAKFSEENVKDLEKYLEEIVNS